MTPYSIQNLLIKCGNIKSVKDNIVEEKYNFCVSFEKEENAPKGYYPEEIFDFIYNIYDNRRVFRPADFNNIINDIFDMNFQNYLSVLDYIKEKYNLMAHLMKDYFCKVFRIDTDDTEIIYRNFMDNLKENRIKLIKEF
jgi:hypothetical protein